MTAMRILSRDDTLHGEQYVSLADAEAAIFAARAAERERCCRVVVVQCDDERLNVARRTILAIRAGDDYHGDVDRDGLLMV